VLVQEHAKNERERVSAEQLVGGGVLGDAELRHARQCAAHDLGHDSVLLERVHWT
jgi:hypothetical protein